MNAAIETMSAARVVTFADEFVGRAFLGTGTRAKGAFVSARFVLGGRKVEVTFRPEKPTNPFGPLDVTEFPSGATLRFAR